MNWVGLSRGWSISALMLLPQTPPSSQSRGKRGKERGMFACFFCSPPLSSWVQYFCCSPFLFFSCLPFVFLFSLVSSKLVSYNQTWKHDQQVVQFWIVLNFMSRLMAIKIRFNLELIDFDLDPLWMHWCLL